MFRHPSSVCMTYFNHMKFSLYLSYEFAKGSVCALIHGIVPDVFITHSSDLIIKLTNDLKNVGCRDLTD